MQAAAVEPAAAPVDARQPASLGPRGMRFAVLAHPTVQLVRFGTKIVLARFVGHALFGEVMFSGLMVQLASIIALVGLDDATIFAKKIDAVFWGRLRRVHNLT